MKYTELLKKHQDMVNALPMHFAFGQEQFDEMLTKNGWSIDDIEHVGFGGYMLKKDIPLYKQTMDSIAEEKERLLKTDMKLFFDAVEYEAGNHEYCITYDDGDVVYALGLTFKDISNNEEMTRTYLAAIRQYLESCNY